MRASTIAIVLLAAVAPALAQSAEKIFHLKNGRHVQGTLLSETKTSYLVQASGGELVLAKSAVASIEDVAPTQRKIVTPSKPDPTPIPVPAVPGSRRGTPAQEGSGPAIAVVASPSGSDALASVRARLVAVPAEGTGDPEARRKAIEAIRKNVALPDLVAICSEPGPGPHDPPPAGHAVAFEIVASASPDEVRPILARALRAASFTKGVPTDLLRLVVAVGPDTKGLVEQALLARAALLVEHGSLDVLEPVFEKVGTPASLQRLYGWILAAATPADSLAPLTRIASGIIERSPERDEALRPLSRLLDPMRPPAWPNLSSAFQILGRSKGEMETTVGLMLDAVEDLEIPASATAAHAECLGSAYDALASIGSVETRRRLLASLDAAKEEERRLAVLHSIAGLATTGDGNQTTLIEHLVERMSATESKAEIGATARALRAITGKTFGDDPAEWTAYLRTLRP